jgi:DME family drug/metabolite transporter
MRQRGSWYVIAAAMLWGTTGTAQALAPDGAQPVIVGTVRLVVGGIALMAFALMRGVLRDGKRWSIWPTLLAALSMAAYQLFFFAGVAKTGVVVGTMVGIGSAPIMTGLLGYLVLGERPGRKWGMATALAVVGCGLLVASGGSIHIDILGILLALGAGLSYAIFTLVSKELLEDHPPEAVMAVAFFLGAVLLFPLFFRADLVWLFQPRGLVIGLWLGFVTVAVAYTLFARGLKLLPVATAGTLTLAEPLTAATLGVFLLGERITPLAFLGIVLIFTGLVILTLKSNRSPIERPLA